MRNWYARLVLWLIRPALQLREERAWNIHCAVDSEYQKAVSASAHDPNSRLHQALRSRYLKDVPRNECGVPLSGG